MKKNILNLLVISSCIIILIELLIYKTLVVNTVIFSINLWINTIIPSLFPFFIISDILIQYNVTNYIPKHIKNFFCKLFEVSEYSIGIFFLSLLSGFPSNARNTRNYYENGYISLDEANHILSFTHFSNPLFILSTVAIFFFHHEEYGLIILLSHYLSNIIIGIISRKKITTNLNNYTKPKKKSQNFGYILTNSISSSINTILLIFGTLTSFLIISSLLIKNINLPPYPSTILKCILEITMGLKSLSTLNLPDIYNIVIASMAISFGGLSVHLQVISQICDTDISYSSFFIGRIWQAILSGITSYIIYITIH